MKPAPFDYSAPGCVADALALLADLGPEGKVLAGGQSLVPMLNMRLAAPGHLVDINGLGAELGGIDAGDAGVRVGALARHCAVERSAAVAAVLPLLGQALAHVAHPVIRNRGTVVGSLAHADPSAELPAVLCLLGGSVQVATVDGERTVAAMDLFAGPMETSLRPAELITSAWFPALPEGTATAFVEVARRRGDYAICGVAVAVTRDAAGAVTNARAAYLSVSDTPLVLDLTEVLLSRPAPGDRIVAAGRLAAARVTPDADIHASADYRRHLAGVLTERALRKAVA